MKKKIIIIDYGLGNIISAQQSFLKTISDKKLNAEVIISDNSEDIKTATHIVLPGQGAFKSCMDGLKNIKGVVEELEIAVIKNKIPFLGICVGMQLLAEKGYENGSHSGLGWIKGSIKKINAKNIKLPHMGWNTVEIKKNGTKMYFNKEIKDFYFVHSYYFDCLDEKNIIGLTDYGLVFPSIVGKENIYGVQFHPEKSSNQGLELIYSFLLL